MDCQDKSDEYHCTQIKIDESNYLMEYVPRDPNGKDKLEVEAIFVVKEIMEINEPEVSKPFEIKNQIRYKCTAMNIKTPFKTFTVVFFHEVLCSVDLGG